MRQLTKQQPWKTAEAIVFVAKFAAYIMETEHERSKRKCSESEKRERLKGSLTLICGTIRTRKRKRSLAERNWIA
jgi:hypothetical protein